MKKKKPVRLLALLLALLMPVVTATVAAADNNADSNEDKVTVYSAPDANTLTGFGQEPEELSVSAAAIYREKAWYEYVTYSEHPISSWRCDDNTRILFYDPYTYSNTMIMEVELDPLTPEFSTMSAITISHTTQKTIESKASSTYTNTKAEQEGGRDKTYSKVTNSGDMTTTYNHSINNTQTGTKEEKTTYGYREYIYQTGSFTLTDEISSETKIELSPTGTGVAEVVKIGGSYSDTTNFNTDIVTDSVTNTTEYKDGYTTSTNYTGTDTITDNTSSETEGWTEFAARITTTVGSSKSTSTGWSEMEGTTVTKTFNATHFAPDGVTPLSWAIAHYSVQMPVKCVMQTKLSGEWVPIATNYVLLTTIQGTCRTWMQNGQNYYEDWATGEPVTSTDFWSAFTTQEALVKAYSGEKLYPIGGES